MTAEYCVLRDWESILSEFPEEKSDVYFHQDYVSLYENENEVTECFSYRDSGKLYLFPYLKRENRIRTETFYDFETAYGYGGPIANTDDAKFLQAAETALIETCKKNGLVAGFVRFCPWLDNHQLIADPSRLLLSRRTVLMDLTSDEETIWMEQIHSKHRNVIRKAEHANLTFEVDDSFENLHEFVDLYRDTMQRLDADDFYLFSDQYFARFRNSMTGKAFLGLVRCEGKIVAAAIFLHQGFFGHYHLAGSLHSHQHLAPNNLLIFQAAMHLKAKGVRYFHLGGGTDSSPDNSLLKFKRRFSPICRDFYVGKFVFNTKQYDEVCRMWSEEFPEKSEKFGHLLLKYRF